jgi:2-iminobutanoate/2-iminopropanoate deaminase
METINTLEAPKPFGHYSQAIVHNGLVYVSGQLAVNPKNNKYVQDSIAAEMEQILKNISEILKEAGTNLQKVLKVNIYITGSNLFKEINDIYTRYFGDHKPARTIIPVKKLFFGFNIEVDVIAAID